APNDRSVGVYVHVPFCTRRCEYCSFNTAPMGDRGEIGRFVGALGREIALVGHASWASDLRIGSVFFGGGTPSLLEPDELATIVEGVRGRFGVDAGAEIT